MLHIRFISLSGQAYMLNYEQFNFLFHILAPSFFLGHIKRNRNLAIPADEREKKKAKQKIRHAQLQLREPYSKSWIG